MEIQTISIQMLIQGRELSLQQRADAKRELENISKQLEELTKENERLTAERDANFKSRSYWKDEYDLKEIELNATYELLSKRTKENKQLKESQRKLLICESCSTNDMAIICKKCNRTISESTNNKTKKHSITN